MCVGGAGSAMNKKYKSVCFSIRIYLDISWSNFFPEFMPFVCT